MIHKQINLYDLIKVTSELPSNCLKKGMIGTVIYVYKTERIFEVEFTADDGSVFCLETLEAYSLDRLDVEKINEWLLSRHLEIGL